MTASSTRQTPLISVIIPFRNAAQWLAETLDSVIAQSQVELDVVLVDDGSDDESAEIVARLAPFARLLRQPALGVSRARNAGTELARGAYIQYLDADDLLELGTLLGRVTALESSGSDVAYCDWCRWEADSAGEFLAGPLVTRVLRDRPDVELLTDAWWPPGALMYRRAVIDRIGGWREDLPVIQDARFAVDAALAGAQFVHVPAVGLRYRVHGASSLSRRNPRAFIEDCVRNAIQLQDRWEGEHALDASRRRGLIEVYAHAASELFRWDRAAFRDVLARIAQLDPRFVPDGSQTKRALAAVVGYGRAEHVAGWYRRLKAIPGGSE